MQDSFIFHKSTYEAIKELPDEDRLLLYDAIARYGICNEEPQSLSGIAKYIWPAIKPSKRLSVKKRNSQPFNYNERSYFNNKEANDLIIQFFDSLSERGKKPTLRSVEMTMKRLREATSVRQVIYSIEAAIAGNYQAIYLKSLAEIPETPQPEKPKRALL